MSNYYKIMRFAAQKDNQVGYRVGRMSALAVELMYVVNVSVIVYITGRRFRSKPSLKNI